MKVCKTCGTEKPLSNFSLTAKAGSITKKKYIRKTDVYSSSCKECKSKRTTDRYWKKTPQERKVLIEQQKFRSIKRLYGLTEEGYGDIIKNQGNVCATCKCDLKTPCVDHCHSTGKVRGILCPSCNLVLGKVGDNPETLLNMIQYLNDNLWKGKVAELFKHREPIYWNPA